MVHMDADGRVGTVKEENAHPGTPQGPLSGAEGAGEASFRREVKKRNSFKPRIFSCTVVPSFLIFVCPVPLLCCVFIAFVRYATRPVFLFNFDALGCNCISR